MEKFKDVFYNWIDKKVNTQIVMIDKICEELDLDPKEWFNVFLKLNQKLDLMENKLFSHIVLQTNLKIYSKNDIRVLKLKKLNYEPDDRAIERVV